MDDNSKLKTEEPKETAAESDKDSSTEESAKSSETETTEAKSNEDSQLSEAGEISSESTSSDVHEPDRAGSEPPAGGEGAELENQDQTSEGKVIDEPTPSASPKPTDPPGTRWYVVHTYSGHENKVALTLKQRVESENLQERILDVLVPMQEKIEIKSGKKVNVKEKIFPGYILVKMVLDDASWLAVRTTQGVTSFVGMGNKPTPISDAEVATIVKFTQTEAPMYKQVFTVNDAVKIVDGPFADFIGKIDSVDGEKGKVRVLVSIFGRETPVELDFLQIKKI